jgi:hypothetical protein
VDLVSRIIKDPIIYLRPSKIYPSSFNSHLPFKNWFIKNIKPRLYVELGAGGGTSFFSVCEIVKTFKIDSRCVAVDTWMGGNQNEFDGEEFIFERFINDFLQYDQFADFARKTFLDAVNGFRDESIDILQILDCQKYQEVKQIFDNYLPKISKRGVILLHNINDYSMQMGVNLVWQEIKSNYLTIKFDHGLGLGLVLVGKDVDPELIELSKVQDKDLYVLKNLFQLLGASIENEYLKNELEKKLIFDNDDLSRINSTQLEKILDLTLEVDRLNKKLDVVEKIRVDLENSRSWKLTAPLRKLKSLIRR